MRACRSSQGKSDVKLVRLVSGMHGPARSSELLQRTSTSEGALTFYLSSAQSLLLPLLPCYRSGTQCAFPSNALPKPQVQ